MSDEFKNFIMASFLCEAPIDRVGDWHVCWRKVNAGEDIVVECSPSGAALPSDTFRTILPFDCVLVLGEEPFDE